MLRQTDQHFKVEVPTFKSLPGSRVSGATLEDNGSLDRCRNIEAFGSEPKGWFLSRGGNRSEHFRCYFAMGKIQGTPCMRSHISVHRATARYFFKSFIFKTEIEKEGLPKDITPDLGAGVLSDRAKSSLVRNRRCAVVSLNASLLRNLGAT